MSNFFIKNPKCVFIHIPKTGGISIRGAKWDDKLKGAGIFSSNYDGPIYHMPQKWLKYFKFAFVRNPYSRVVSAWQMFGGETKFSFDNFLKIVVDDSIDYKNGPGTDEKIRHHTIPQLHPYNCLKYADFIGKFENLQEDFNKICDRLNIVQQKLPHLNESQYDNDYSLYYSEKIKKIVSQYFKEDIEYFEYTFGDEN